MKIKENLDKLLDYINYCFIIYMIILFGSLLIPGVNFTTQYSAVILINLPIIAATFGYSHKIREVKELADPERLSRKLFFEWFILTAFLILVALFWFTLPLPNT
ncbi:MAG: hypothetical protein EAX96_02585 [Candidatus Lokiarchaeota archaeon]|nr:hypothetical protein [Candidatus Lokiarchaeota archaeon]